MKTTFQVNKIDFNFIFQNSAPPPLPLADAPNLLKSYPKKRQLSSECVGVFTQRTAISRKVVGNVHGTIPKDIVGGFELTVVRRNLKEWQERPWTYVCKC